MKKINTISVKKTLFSKIIYRLAFKLLKVKSYIKISLINILRNSSENENQTNQEMNFLEKLISCA